MSSTATTQCAALETMADDQSSAAALWQAPDPRHFAGIMCCVFGHTEVTARAVAAAHRLPLGRALAQLEHARMLGQVAQTHPGHYWCSGSVDDVPIPDPAMVSAARWSAGLFLLASSRAVAAAMPGSLLPPVRVGVLSAPDPTIVDQLSALAWAQLHRPAVMQVAADAASVARMDRRFGLLAIDLALAGIAGAMAAGAIESWQSLAQTVLTAAYAVDDRYGQGYGLEHLGKAAKHQGRLKEAIRIQGDALVLRERMRDERGVVASTNALGLAYWKLGDLPAARERFQRAVRLADANGDLDFSAFARQNLAGVLIADPRYSVEARDTALGLLAQASARHAETGALAAWANCATLRAVALRRSGRPEDIEAAIEVARAGVEAIDTSGELGLAGHEYAELARCLRTAGRSEDATAWAETAWALFRAAGNGEREQALRAEFEVGVFTQSAGRTEAEWCAVRG